jgi:2-keto-4-pentenoate hydratase/2-oxohepta-3-ene-1,7-dioic acid hydratase in catechol pathway
MKIVRFKIAKQISYGFVEQDVVLEISGSPYGEHYVTGREFPLESVELLAPVEPSKIVAVGLNYSDHAGELNMAPPDEPVLFLKPISSLIGPLEKIIIPEQSHRVDFEAELAFVVGKKAKNITANKASEYVYGYTCANDITARDLQEKDDQWTRAKSFDTFCPVGPWVVTDIDPGSLNIKLKLDDELKQSSNTANMVFQPLELLSFISSIMTLYPGDLVITGTPPGVGSLDDGQTVVVEIENIGKLVNKVSS